MNRLLAAAAALATSASALFACSSAPDAAPILDADAGSSGHTDAGAEAVGNECSTLAQAGASVDIVAAKPPVPEAKGGAPTDGTYVLRSVRAFTDIFPEGNTIQAFGAYTLVVSDGATSFEQAVTNKDGELSRAKGALVTDGTAFTATPSCETPAPDGGATVTAGTFTSDGATMILYIVRKDFGITAELAFEKQ